MPVSRFKATCLAAVERVRLTRRPLLITKRGEPIAQVIPAPVTAVPASSFGALAGTVVEKGDIVAPLGEQDWEALR
jgi:prevent-host-death family protein